MAVSRLLASGVWVRVRLTRQRPSRRAVLVPRGPMGMLIEGTLAWCAVRIRWVPAAPRDAGLREAAECWRGVLGSALGSWSRAAFPEVLLLPDSSSLLLALPLAFSLTVYLPFVRHAELVLTKGEDNGFSSQGTRGRTAENQSGWFRLPSPPSLVKSPPHVTHSLQGLR